MSISTFTPEFELSDSKAIADELKYGTGYRIFENALTLPTLEAVEGIGSLEKVLINNNDLGFVRAQWGKYLSNTLALSKECYQIVTSEQILGICRQFFDKPFKITNQRIYETNTKAHLPWHTDNNLQSGNKYKSKHELPGLMFLFYLTDVDKTNPFQLISGSHIWSDQNKERFFTDSFIEKKSTDDIRTIRAPKGSLIICNSHLIHRAEPFNQPGFRRLTYIFQIDEISESHLGHGERLLINPSFVDDTSAEKLTYLGFGSQADYPAFPDTSVGTLLPSDLYALQKQIVPMAIRVLMLALAKRIIPGAMLNKVRNRLYK